MFWFKPSSKGVELRTPSLNLHMEVDHIEPLSTIGAGDTFNAGLIYGLWKGGITREEITNLSKSQWEDLISTAMLFSRAVCMSYDNYLPHGFAEHLKHH